LYNGWRLGIQNGHQFTKTNNKSNYEYKNTSFASQQTEKNRVPVPNYSASGRERLGIVRFRQKLTRKKKMKTISKAGTDFRVCIPPPQEKSFQDL